ncbi:hypothetical protein CHUAL_003749 [Chamberlinius hualienensis]
MSNTRTKHTRLSNQLQNERHLRKLEKCYPSTFPQTIFPHCQPPQTTLFTSSMPSKYNHNPVANKLHDLASIKATFDKNLMFEITVEVFRNWIAAKNKRVSTNSFMFIVQGMTKLTPYSDIIKHFKTYYCTTMLTSILIVFNYTCDLTNKN